MRAGMIAATVLFAAAVAAVPGSALAVPAPLPPMSGPLAADLNPMTVETGLFGPLDLTGVLSAFGVWQTNSAATDRAAAADFSNAQLFLQSTAGWLQFFVQAGAYALPSLGTALVSSGRTGRETYGIVPQAYVKVFASDELSIEMGKLPSLIGMESTFTFQNPNIERGLLWNQTSSVSHGIQLNYTRGSWSGSLSWNDGFYSGRFNWLTVSLSYAFDSNAETLTVTGGANLGHTGYSSFATPLAENNSAIFDLAHSSTFRRWVFTPYAQVLLTPSNPQAGLQTGASAFGGGLLASCKLDDNWSIGVRTEGLATAGRLNLLYGPGSGAWSVTLTPTYQEGVFFGRAEASYVGLEGGQSGFAMGRNSDRESQARLMLETGVLF
jgi:hypothetical protein